MKKTGQYILVFFICINSLSAQMSRGDKFYDNFEYAKAEVYYKRAAHGKTKESALLKLGDCYRLTKDYPKAEQVYAKLIAMNSSNPKVHYYYAEALMNNKKWDEAKKEFAIYSAANPTDKKAKGYIYSCDELKTWNTQPVNYKVYNLTGVNTAVSDFSPVMYRDGIVFISESQVDLVNGNVDGWNGNPYSSIFYSKAEKKDDSVVFGKGHPLSSLFNNDALNGTACFNRDQTEIYFTKADNKGSRNKKFINHPKIYISKIKGSSWKTAEALPFNSDEYSIAHPSLSADGNTLYFSSTMPGGFGGADIYVVKKNGDSWGKPENLGADINSSGDEMYPQISADGRFYFSSNGWPGYGGLDIYSSVFENGKWTHASNMNPPINSSRDDFGLIYKDNKTGYFSSNREGGKGADDIYGFVQTGKIDALDGKILESKNLKDGAGDMNVLLLTEKGEPLQHTTTDKSGFFRFDNLTADQKYQVKLEVNDPNIKLKDKYYMADSKSRLVRVTIKTSSGLVVFNSLPSDLKSLKSLSETDADASPSIYSIAGSLLVGEDKVPLSDATVSLKNDKGEVVQTTKTNSFGSFVFTNLPSDQNYLVTLDDKDPAVMNKKILLVNKSGKEITTSENGIFRFQILATDKMMLKQLTVKEDDLRADMKGKIFLDDESKKPLINSKLRLVDENGNTVQTTSTDGNGLFNFSNLPADKKYLVMLDETDSKIKNDGSYYMTDANGNIIRKMLFKGGKFSFEILPTESRSLTNIYFDDPWLQVQKLKLDSSKKENLSIIENIYFDYRSADLLSAAKITLDKVVQVMKQNTEIVIELNSHTDARGTAEFNLTLSQKRAINALDYMASKGIDKRRLTSKGFGETKLLNKCKDGVECTEDEHAQNRRLEFKISKIKK